MIIYMTNLEHDILNFELFQISVFLDELNEMLKKDMVTLIKLKQKRYRAKRGSGARIIGGVIVRYKALRNPAQPFSPKQWFYLPDNSWGWWN